MAKATHCAVCGGPIPKEGRRRKYCSKKCYETTITGGRIILLELGPLADVRPVDDKDGEDEKLEK